MTASPVGGDFGRAASPRHDATVGDPRKAKAAQPDAWLEGLLRAGYAAKGILYLLIGGTGVLVAAGLADEARGSSGAIRLVSTLPMGRVLIVALAIGLAGYAALSFIAAVRAPEVEHGAHRSLATTVTRAADALAGVVYAALVALALRLLGDPQTDTGAVGTRWAADLLGAPGGQPMLGIAGLVTCAAALYLALKATVLGVNLQFDRRALSARAMRVVEMLARTGIATRAVLFGLCGWLLLRAAWSGEARQVGGIGDALDVLDQAPAGAATVGVVAAGCLAYGSYQLAKACFRRVRLRRAPEALADKGRSPT